MVGEKGEERGERVSSTRTGRVASRPAPRTFDVHPASPRTNEKFVQWVVGEREDDHVTVVLKLGSFVSGSGRARSVKAAKTEAAAAAFGAAGRRSRIRSIDGSDASSNARSERNKRSRRSGRVCVL